MSSSGLTRGSLYEILDFIARNFRIPCHPPAPLGDLYRNSTIPCVIEGGKATKARNSRILYDEILESSRGMTKNASRGMTQGLGILEFILLKYVNLFFKNI